MKDFFSASDLSRYSTIEELEKARDYFFDIKNDITRKLIQGERVFADDYYRVENLIRQIDSEIERRTHRIQFSPKGRCAVAIMSSQNYTQTPAYYHTQPQPYLQPQSINHVSPSLLPTDIDTLKEQLVTKNKTIEVLQKEVEGVTNELDHEKTHSDNQRRVIKWLSGENGSFYKNDVDDDDDK